VPSIYAFRRRDSQIYLPNQPEMSIILVSRGVTAAPPPHNISYVPSWTAQMLTKRRAVDFCRVATALCQPSPAGRRLRVLG
jgi:hypothetical protein